MLFGRGGYIGKTICKTIGKTICKTIGKTIGKTYNFMKEKKIKDGKFPTYTFRLDPKIIKILVNIKGNMSWNKFFKNLIVIYEKRGNEENLSTNI